MGETSWGVSDEEAEIEKAPMEVERTLERRIEVEVVAGEVVVLAVLLVIMVVVVVMVVEGGGVEIAACSVTMLEPK